MTKIVTDQCHLKIGVCTNWGDRQCSSAELVHRQREDCHLQMLLVGCAILQDLQGSDLELLLVIVKRDQAADVVDTVAGLRATAAAAVVAKPGKTAAAAAVDVGNLAGKNTAALPASVHQGKTH